MNATVQMNISARRTLPPLNDHICEQLVIARDTARYLMAQGFVVLEVKIGKRRPRINIQTSSRCTTLEAAVRMSCKDGLTRKNVWVADVRGCQVEWTEAGH